MWRTHFWQRMEEAFGPRAATTFAADHALTRLGDRTVNQALAAGVSPKQVWQAVWLEMRLPEHLR